MAADYEANPPRPDEVLGPIEINPAYLRKGRPTKGTPASGKTPSMTIRLPEPIRVEIAHRVEAGQSSSESELIRRAVIEYLERHPVKS